jgi:hypothetical protein
VQITQNGCTVTSNCTTIGTVDVADFGIKQLVRMYPNPADLFINISNEIPIKLKIYTPTGILVMEQTYSKGIQPIDLTNYSSGMYLVKVTALSGSWENQSALYRMIVK